MNNYDYKEYGFKHSPRGGGNVERLRIRWWSPTTIPVRTEQASLLILCS
jgi:hypothetical protein